MVNKYNPSTSARLHRSIAYQQQGGDAMLIYKATNIVNGKIYIGQTVNTLKYRKDQHFRESKSGSRQNTYFHNAIIKYGENNFVFEIIDYADSIEELNNKEAYWISEYNSTDRNIGYNLDSGGKNCKKSESTKKKISECKLQMWQNDEIAKKCRAGLQKGVDAMKKKKGSSAVEFTCIECGKTLLIDRYMLKDRKFCSISCSTKYRNKHQIKESIAANNASRREKIRDFVIKWCKDNKHIVTNCNMNNVSTVYKPLSNVMKEMFDIHDFRTITLAVVGSNSNKKFATEMKKMLNDEENICRSGLN